MFTGELRKKYGRPGQRHYDMLWYLNAKAQEFCHRSPKPWSEIWRLNVCKQKEVTSTQYKLKGYLKSQIFGRSVLLRKIWQCLHSKTIRNNWGLSAFQLCQRRRLWLPEQSYQFQKHWADIMPDIALKITIKARTERFISTFGTYLKEIIYQDNGKRCRFCYYQTIFIPPCLIIEY